jgi:deoxyribodipyrimidine photo-lyase
VASGYAERHDDLAADGTSRLSPYLHFGCVSPREVASRVADEAFIRQLCWRDFYHQVTAAYPRITTEPLRRVEEDWRDDPEALRRWQAGATGVPIVDAGMRQLAAEGFLHNRARLLVASYLTKQLGLDWRAGAAWFAEYLLDGDVPNNYGNWQWVAGTGNDTKPYRRFNPIRQAHRYDPDGTYVRRYVPELAGVPGGAVHEPWRLAPAVRRTLDYPSPVDADRGGASWLPAAV